MFGLIGFAWVCVGGEIMRRHFGAAYFDPWDFAVYVSYAAAGGLFAAGTRSA